jgi:hypothetical protein
MERPMAANKIVVGVVLSAVVSVGCDDGPTEPTDTQFGPVRSLTLTVTPDHLTTAGPVTIDLRATSDAGQRVAPDAVRLALVNNGRETPNPVLLDDEGRFTQRLYLSSSTTLRATAGSIVVERPVSVDVPAGGAPQPVPPGPPPPAPVPAPTPPPPAQPVPAVDVTLVASPLDGTTATTFTFTATASPRNGAGPVVSFDWDDDGDGIFELLASPNPHTVVFSSAGSKTVSVRANSSTPGVSGTASATVTVGINVPFTVTLTATPECVLLGTPITFRAVTVNEPGGPLVHEWDFEGDGTFDPPSTVLGTIVHTYETTGGRTARVRVTATGQEAVAERAVTVRPASGSCP